MSKLKNRVNETSMSFEGQLMTIIAYRSNKDIDVQFEDGTIVTNKAYIHFKSGTIKNPYKDALDRVGEVRVANNGQKMTIIAYHDYYNVDICFEDDTIVYAKCYKDFKNGAILNPNAKTKEAVSRIGEVSISSNGQKMTLIAWRKSTDIDVKFEDETIVCNKNYGHFKEGLIFNPNYTASKYIGKTSVHKLTGLKMTIIAFRSCADLDIEFEDGTIVYNKSWQNFRLGKISYKKIDRSGERSLANNGLWMEVTEYTNTSNIIVKFEDNAEVKCTYKSFKDGYVKHPTLRLTRNKCFSKSSELYGFSISKLAFTHNNESNYICKCKKCGYKDILTPTEMSIHDLRCFNE